MGDTRDQRDNGSSRSKALLIGIQYKDQQYGDKPLDLKGPREDVEAMKEYLISTWNYPRDNIFQLVDEPEYVQPTRTNILKYLDLLVQAPVPKTRLFLYYSGHGYQVRTDSTTELDGKDETLVPLDWKEGLIRDNVLYDRVVNRLPPGCRFTAVFDCCHSGTLLDLPCTRERPPLMHPDEMPVSPITTMYYTARRPSLLAPAAPPPPDLALGVRQGPCVTKLSENKHPQRAMTHPPIPQELSKSLTRPLRGYMKSPIPQELSKSLTRPLRGYVTLPRTKTLGPKAHWIKKWFEVFRKPMCTVDINSEYSVAILAPFTSQLAATHPNEVGYPLRRQSIGHEDVVFISPIRESFNENECQLPWELPTRALEEPAPTTLDMQYKRHSESQANSSIRGVSDPLLLPTVFSIGACADSDEVIEGRTTNAGLLRTALIQCLAEAKDQTWEQLLEGLWKFTNESPEFFSQTEVWPVIGSIKKELTDVVAF